MKQERLTNSPAATIASGASLSGEIDLGGATLVGILMPSAWTAAALTFQASDASGGTFADAYDDAGTEINVSAAASRMIVIGTATKAALAAVRFLKIRSGTSAVPVNQAAACTLVLVLK